MSKTGQGIGAASRCDEAELFGPAAGACFSAMTVERMRSPDIPAIMEVENQIYPFPWTAGNFRDSLAAGYSGWVLRDSSRTSGKANLSGYAIVMHVLDEAHLMNLSVSADRQRQGIGRQFLCWLCRQSHSAGAAGMFLEVRPSNLPALRLYEQSGFQRIGVRRNYYPNGASGREDAIVMRKSLDQRGLL